jgi:predicted DNA-binding protein
MTSKQFNIRVPDIEMKALERYARKAKRTKTDVIREFIRSLPTYKSLSITEAQSRTD